MPTAVTAHLDDDIYDHVGDEHERTGQSKSQIVNDLARQGMEADGATDPQPAGFQSLLGQSLFVAGPIVALLAQMGPGIGMMVLGLGLLIYGPMQRHMARGDSVGEAFKATLLH